MEEKKLPRIDGDAVILPGAQISGDVTIAGGCSVWFNAVIRGDTASITVGEGTNIQDNAVLHSGRGFPVSLGRDVTVGHGAIVHGCAVGDGSLVGMGAILMNGAVVGTSCIVGAGTLVTEGTVIPDGSMALGSPARVVRPLRPEEIEQTAQGAAYYRALREEYR